MFGIAHPLGEVDALRASLDIDAAVRLFEEPVVDVIPIVRVRSDRQFGWIVFTLMVEVPLARGRILCRLVIGLQVLRVAAVRSGVPRVRPSVEVGAGLFQSCLFDYPRGRFHHWLWPVP